MINFIVKHSGFGLGKVFSSQKDRFTVLFFSPEQIQVVVAGSDGRQVLKRALLPVNTVCESANGSCRITNAIPSASCLEPHRYRVESNDGLAREVSEIELVPKEIPSAVCPLEVLVDRRLEGYATFQKREALTNACWSSIRMASGLRALLSSRIDLRPHQAYVAGTVLMDRIPRYILADEVGLGKTIEAGIVIHDLLERKAKARVLILSPGTLTQQWMCELYTKFSGRVFNLLELRRQEIHSGDIPEKLITSYSDALTNKRELGPIDWDMVVVDEAHHLLALPGVYSFVQDLASKVPGLLLLSAIPAQHREDEYLRLLALLEPERYKPGAPDAKLHFRQLYDRQIELGRKLSYISRRLVEFSNGAEGAERIVQKVAELVALPVLANDESLASSAAVLDPSRPSEFVAGTELLLHHIGDRYRISRRILRNRRSQLFETEPDLRTTRVLNRLPFQPDQLEIDASNAARRLLILLKNNAVDESVLLPFSRLLLQTLCDPDCLAGFASLAGSDGPSPANPAEFDGQIGYHDWQAYASNLWKAVRQQLDSDSVNNLQKAAAKWSSSEDISVRTAYLVSHLKRRRKDSGKPKFLIFAGSFGLAERIAKHLSDVFGKESVAKFTWDMETKAKEKGVSRLKRDSECRFMVSDESGGEGRNFQFVDELIHFDTPWHVSKVEQRIGRLDRLGRHNPQIISNVLLSSGSEEEGLINCLDMGFQIFERSISGLEFALTEIQSRMTQTAITEGCEGLFSFAKEVRVRVEAERAIDDVQGTLDAASLERVSAEVFLKAQSTPDKDLLLEAAFCDWHKFIAGNGSLGFPPTGDSPENSVIEFRPNQLADNPGMPAPKKGDTQGDRVGTFRRQVAQDRPDLEFFSFGNDFFDAVCSSLYTSPKGRSFAVECRASHLTWRGFEFSYRLTSDQTILKDHPGLLKHLDRVLAVRPEHCFIGEDLQPVQDFSKLLMIRKSLTIKGHNDVWMNFTLNNSKVQLLEDYYAKIGWDALVTGAEGVARLRVKDRFSFTLSPVIEMERVRINDQMRQAQDASADGWQDEVGGLKALLEAIDSWQIDLDTVGFLSINGGIMS